MRWALWRWACAAAGAWVAVGAAGYAQAQGSIGLGGLQPGFDDRSRLEGLTAIAVARQSFHSFCPFAVQQPSVTWVDLPATWAAMLKAANVQPPPYAERDVDFESQRLMVVAASNRPGPTASLEVMKAPLAVAYNAAAQRLSVRVVERDSPQAPGMMNPAVLGQPCLVLWLRLNKPVREVIARNTRDQLLGRAVARP